MRLDKLLGQAGYGSRNQVKKLIRSQQVRVDGRLVTRDGLNVDPAIQDVRVSGKILTYSPDVYFILNKPSGVLSAVKDQTYETVFDLLRPEDRRSGLYPVGRLDRDTQGLVLLTNNGPLGYRLLHPKYHVTKTYEVEVNDALNPDALAFFAQGVTFRDGTQTKPAQLEILSSQPGFAQAKVTISEGKFHQIKKMFLAYGVKVTHLKRTHFGPLELGSLKPGDYRPLTTSEKLALKAYMD